MNIYILSAEQKLPEAERIIGFQENNDLVSDAGTLLFEQARLMEGKMPSDPAQFSKIMNQFLLKVIPD